MNTINNELIKESDEIIAMIQRFQFKPDESHLPLANKPERILEMLHYLNKANSNKETVENLAKHFAITTRQIHFYAETGERSYGLFIREPGYLSLSLIGKSIADKERLEQASYLKDKMRRIPLIKEIIYESEGKELKDIINRIEADSSLRERYSDSSIKRRAGTIIAWLKWFDTFDASIDEDELSTYIRDNTPLIYSIIHKLNQKKILIDECYAEGTVGLHKALMTYKPDMNTKFTTYAHTCIKNEILYFLRKERRWTDAYHLSIDAKSTNINSEDDNTGFRAGSVFSLEEKLVNGDTEVLDKVVRDEENDWMRKAMKSLLPSNEYIFQKRYYENLTQAEIGRELDMSQANVSKRILSSIEFLKIKAKSEKILF